MRFRHTAIGEFQDAVLIATVGDVLVAVADGKARRALVDQESGDQLFLAARGFLFACGGKEDDEGSLVGMGDEMLGAGDDEVFTIGLGESLHAAQIRTDSRLGEGEAIRGFAGNGGEEIFLALFLIAGEQDVGGAENTVPMQRIGRAAKLALIKYPCQCIEAGTADIFWHVGSIEAGGDSFGFQFITQLRAQEACFLHFSLMGKEFCLHKITRGLDDELLFF